MLLRRFVTADRTPDVACWEARRKKRWESILTGKLTAIGLRRVDYRYVVVVVGRVGRSDHARQVPARVVCLCKRHVTLIMT